MDLDAPALWQIKEFSSIYDNEELDENADGDEDEFDEIKTSSPVESETFKKRALKSWLAEIGGFFLSSWCFDSLMALMRKRCLSGWMLHLIATIEVGPAISC